MTMTDTLLSIIPFPLVSGKGMGARKGVPKSVCNLHTSKERAICRDVPAGCLIDRGQPGYTTLGLIFHFGKALPVLPDRTLCGIISLTEYLSIITLGGHAP